MPVISPQQAGSLNQCAFLDMIAYSEGTSNSPITQNDGYDVLVSGMNGPQRFSNYASHPDILVKVNSAGLQSTAAGRYQLLYRYWQAYSVQLDLADFSPVSQDLIALQQIRERGALPYIDNGNFDKAVLLCSNIWASLPGNSYGQHQNQSSDLKAAYLLNGGTVT